MKRMSVLIAALALAVAVSAVRAQPVPPTDPPAGMPSAPDAQPRPVMPPENWIEKDDDHAPDSASYMGRERRMLEAVRITRMTEALNLSEDQIATFFPRMHKMEDEMRELGRQRRRLIRELERQLQAKAKEPELRSLVEQIDKLDAQRFQRMENEHAALDKLLSVEQRAKLRVFNHRFDDEIRSMVRDIREKRMRQIKP